jgi:hypothetical protein
MSSPASAFPGVQKTHEESKAMGVVFFHITGFALAGSADRFASNRFARHVISFGK